MVQLIKGSFDKPYINLIIINFVKCNNLAWLNKVAPKSWLQYKM